MLKARTTILGILGTLGIFKTLEFQVPAKDFGFSSDILSISDRNKNRELSNENQTIILGGRFIFCPWFKCQIRNSILFFFGSFFHALYCRVSA